ncbi:MAG: hypothetical protein ACK4UN_05115 [Limisphaerales bacterium]
MKSFLGCFIIILALSTSSLQAETSPEHVEKIDRMSRDIETLIAANADLQRRISGLVDEINRLRQDQARSANDTAVQAVREDVRRLAERVQEVDRKRISDKEEIAKDLDRNFDRIEKLLKSQSSASSAARSTPAPAQPSRPVPTEGFEYVVKPGDTLLGIIGAANSQFRQQGLKTVTLQNVLDANPNLKPERMRVGEKIFIPAYK